MLVCIKGVPAWLPAAAYLVPAGVSAPCPVFSLRRVRRTILHFGNEDLQSTSIVGIRGTGGGRLPGFRGRVLQLIGLARFGGVFASLEYQQQADVPAPAVEVEVEATEATAGDSDTATQGPPSYIESGPAAPVSQPPVRLRRRQRPRRTDTLLRVSSQCDQSLELTEKLLDAVRGIKRSAIHMTSLARRMAAAQERTAAAQERAAAAKEQAAAAQDRAAAAQERAEALQESILQAVQSLDRTMAEGPLREKAT
ncbi:uncharacterized protein LOC142776613 [Rhipicephalus microplus]|uniref:uncharacterized protein LOC142776613 n=1 Tax=Rhipicephalus microplus TaxID=6941 RepID=UPI003F6B3467